MPLAWGTCAYCGADRDEKVHADDCLINIPGHALELVPAWVAGYEKKPFILDTPDKETAYRMGQRSLDYLDQFFAVA